MRTGALGGTGLASPTDALLSEQRLLGASGALANLARQFRGQSKYPAEWSPYYLFANGEAGAWYDPSDFSTLFQDSAGTVPVTALGQPVGRVLDKSGRGNHLVQSTAAARPTVQARVNVHLQYTDVFTSPFWSHTSVTVTTSTEVEPPPGLSRFVRYSATAADSRIWRFQEIFYGGIYTMSCFMRARDTSIGTLAVNDSGLTNETAAVFDLSAGTSSVVVTGAGGGVSNASTAMTDAGNGWWRCEFRFTLAGQRTPNIRGNKLATDDLYLGGVQLEYNTAATTYQRVTTNSDYVDVGGLRYLNFDGADDFLVSDTQVPLGSTDTLSVIAGLQRDALGNRVAFELSASLGSNTGALFHAIEQAVVTDWRIDVKGTATNGYGWTQFPAADRRVFAYTAKTAATSAASALAVRLNGVASTPTQSASAASSGPFGNHLLYVGSRGGTASRWLGRMYQLVLRGVATDQTTLANAEQWVAQRTGVTL